MPTKVESKIPQLTLAKIAQLGRHGSVNTRSEHYNNNNNNNNNNIFIFFRQSTRRLHGYLSTSFAVPLLLRNINNVTLFIPISSRKRDTREAR